MSPKTTKKAVAWFREAAEQGDAEAQFNLGIMYHRGRGVSQDNGKARAWYLKAAQQGDSSAQFNLAFVHAEGQGGPKDYVQAYKWVALSAKQGDKKAAKLRDRIVTAMTPAQLAEAKRLVAEWKRKKAGQGGAAGG